MDILDSKTVIWDLDGTLLNSFDLFVEITTAIFKRDGVSVPEHYEFLKHFHGTLEDTFRALAPSLDEVGLKKLTATFLIEQNDHYATVEHHLYKDAVSLGRRLKAKGVRQLIVTNRAHTGRGNASPIHIVQNSSLIDFIDHVVTGDDGVHRKPKPAVIDQFLRDGVVEPGSTTVIGDQFVDAEFAHNLQAQAILVDRTRTGITHLERLGNGLAGRVAIVDSLNEVLS